MLSKLQKHIIMYLKIINENTLLFLRLIITRKKMINVIKKIESIIKEKEKNRRLKLWQILILKIITCLPAKCYLIIAQILRRNDMLDEAETIIGFSIKNYSSNWKLENEYAMIAKSKKDWQKAIRCWEKLIEKHNKVPLEIYISLSNAYFHVKSYEEAEAYINKALKIQPHNLNVLKETSNQLYKRAYEIQLLMKAYINEHQGNKETHILKTVDAFTRSANYNKNFLDASKGKPQYHQAVQQYVNSQLQLSESLILSNNNVEAYSVMQEVVRLLYSGLPPLIYSLLIAVSESFLMSIEKKQNFQVDVKSAIEACSADLLTSSEWLAMYDFLCFNGLLQSGLTAREKATEKSYLEAKNDLNNDFYLKRAICAAIDRADFIKAEYFINAIRKASKIENKRMNELIAYYELNKGNYKEFLDAWHKRTLNESTQFMDYVRGKNVAIVGPAPSGHEDSGLIDSFDIVVRLNYRGLEFMPEANEFGNRVNVSYYSTGMVNILNKQKAKFPFTDLDFSVFKKSSYNIIGSRINKTKTKPINANKYFFYKYPNLIPETIFDILLYYPEKVHLFKTNFYTDRTTHDNNYEEKLFVKNSLLKNTKLQRMMSVHDLLCQISFIRSLWKGKVIEVDQGCANVLQMTDRQYMSKMESVHLQ